MARTQHINSGGGLAPCLAFCLAAAGPSGAAAEETVKCLVVRATHKMAQAVAFSGKASARAQLLSSQSRYGREHVRNHVWTAYERIVSSPAWEGAMARCLSGAVHDVFVDWQGVAGFQGGMEDLPPHRRCAVWLAALEVQESDCLPEAERAPDWPRALERWLAQNQRGFAMGNYVTDYAVTELAAGNTVKAHGLARGVAEAISRGGIPMSDYRNRALAVMAEAAQRKPDPEWEYWARYEAAAGHLRSGGSPVHADPWYAEALLRRCGMAGLDCPAADLQAARQWALERGSLLAIEEMDDCDSPLAARQAALAGIWLANKETAAERQAAAAAAERIAAMESACPDRVARAIKEAQTFAQAWSGYPHGPP